VFDKSVHDSALVGKGQGRLGNACYASRFIRGKTTARSVLLKRDGVLVLFQACPYGLKVTKGIEPSIIRNDAIIKLEDEGRMNSMGIRGGN